jgi:hypothetical protein
MLEDNKEQKHKEQCSPGVLSGVYISLPYLIDWGIRSMHSH